MRNVAPFLILFSCVGCVNYEGGEDMPSFSTVDSNTVGATDSVPAILYLDDPKSDSFPMALDSTGPIIEPIDTQYSSMAHSKTIE